MKAQFEIGNGIYFADLTRQLNIGITLNFDGSQPNTYGVPKAKSMAYEDGSFIGDVLRGGSCNFEVVEMIPHCNGTHTECIGHITKERVHIGNTDFKRISTAVLITINPSVAKDVDESYNNTMEPYDKLITKELIEKALSENQQFNYDSLVIRTLPNGKNKLDDNYSEIPPYFTSEAMEYINSLNIDNLLVDVPSVDRLYDGGMMNNHRIYWQVNEERELNELTRHKTITEFIYVDDNISDGIYLLNIQMPNFLSDAAPSAPILYELEKK